VPAHQFTARDEQALVSAARTWLGSELRIEVEHLDALPRTASGKLRFVISDLPAARLDGLPAAVSR
jgi:hypothetical protein